MGRFKESEINKFLVLYKQHECLWKCNHKHYKVKLKRKEAYSRIKEEMNLDSILEVTQKIKSFRDTYASERAKIKKSSMTAIHPSQVYRPKLRWYNLADSFLNNTDGREIGHSMMPEDTRDSTLTRRNVFAPQETAEYSDETISSPRIPTYKRMKMKKNHKPTQCQRNTEPLTDHHQLDEFYHFGMNIAMQLRSLPLVKALNLQTKFHHMLCEQRIANEQNYFSNFENERCSSASVSLVSEENPDSFHENIPFHPKDENMKTEYSIEDISNVPSTGF